jgi:hypothetical protein
MRTCTLRSTLRASLLAAFVAYGCGPGAPAPESAGVEIVDSAGVELVRNLDGRVDTTGVAVELRLRIGEADGPETLLFHQIGGIATDDAGRIFVADQGTRAIRVFDADGAYIRRFGAAGAGPGEFARVGTLFRWRDTIYAADSGRSRGFVFDTAGTLLGTIPMRLPDGTLISPLAAGPDGWFVLEDTLSAREIPYQVGVATRPAWRLARVDPSRLEEATRSRVAADSLLHPVAPVPGPRTWGVVVNLGGQPFVGGNSALFDPAPTRTLDGRGYAYVAEGWPYVIDVYDAGGRHRRRISRAHTEVPVTDNMVEELLRRVRTHYDTTGANPTWYPAYEGRAGLPRVGFVPVVGAMLASADGWLWVRRSDVVDDPVHAAWTTGQPPQPTVWDVFDPDGRYVRSVRLPAGFTPRVVASDAVVGVQRDEFGVEAVAGYEITRSRS